MNPEALVQELANRDIDATWEYPGFILIQDRQMPVLNWAFGTANGVWGGDVTHEDGRSLWAGESAVPGTATDVVAIADAIEILLDQSIDALTVIHGGHYPDTF